MADETLLTLSQVTEAQMQGSTRLYGVLDPSGVPADAFLPMSAMLGGFYKIAPSVSASDLTLGLTHLDGSNPSATSPLGFKIGDDWQMIEGDVSFTKADGTNWANLGSTELGGKTHDLFVYVIQETGAQAGTKLGWARHPFGKTMNDFSFTSTDKNYIAGGHTNFTTTDEVTLIGRFAAQLSSGTFAWSIPTPLVRDFPIFFSEWRTWQPVGQTAGSMTYSLTATEKAEYRMNYNSLDYEYRVAGTTGGVAASALKITNPYTATNGANLTPRAAYATDGGSVLTGHCLIGASTLEVSKYDASNFGLGATRYSSSGGSYRIG